MRRLDQSVPLTTRILRVLAREPTIPVTSRQLTIRLARSRASVTDALVILLDAGVVERVPSEELHARSKGYRCTGSAHSTLFGS
jgi:DNA-binding MarR family transcriptional regulator